MFEIVVISSTPDLHTVFKAKLERYGFKREGPSDIYTCGKIVDNIGGIAFYKNILEGPNSPLKVTAKKIDEGGA